MIERLGIRVGFVVAIAMLAALLTAGAGASRQALPTSPTSTAARACVSAGGAYDVHAWRAPEDAFAGFSCTFVTFDGPTAISNVPSSVRTKISDACSRAGGTVVDIATYTYVGYGCIWGR